MASIRLTPRQAAILFTIHKDGGVSTMSKLKKELSVFSSDIKLLERKYLVKADGSEIKLTELGRRLIENNLELFKELYKAKKEHKDETRYTNVYIDFPL